jgi:hypothetical protein
VVVLDSTATAVFPWGTGFMKIRDDPGGIGMSALVAAGVDSADILTKTSTEPVLVTRIAVLSKPVESTVPGTLVGVAFADTLTVFPAVGPVCGVNGQFVAI